MQIILWELHSHVTILRLNLRDTKWVRQICLIILSIIFSLADRRTLVWSFKSTRSTFLSRPNQNFPTVKVRLKLVSQFGRLAGEPNYLGCKLKLHRFSMLCTYITKPICPNLKSKGGNFLTHLSDPDWLEI